MTLSTVPWVVIFAIYFRWMLVRDHEQRLADGFVYDTFDIVWDRTNTVRYPLICTAAGVFAGLFGVGGGIVKGPLMLEMGVLPVVASCTAATMILFTTASASFSFYIFGLLNMQYAPCMFVVGFVATLVGQCTMQMFFGSRQSPIVLSIGLVIVLASLLIFIYTLVENIGRPLEDIFTFADICGHGIDRRLRI